MNDKNYYYNKIEDLVNNEGGILKLKEPFCFIDDECDKTRLVDAVAIANVKEEDHSRLVLIADDFENWDLDDFLGHLEIERLFNSISDEK